LQAAPAPSLTGRRPLMNELPRQPAIKLRPYRACGIFPLDWPGLPARAKGFGPPPKQDDGQTQAAAISVFVVERVDRLAGCGGGALRVLAARLRVDSGNYGLVTGMKPDGVVAVTVGLATLVSGTAGGVVVVIVCSVACGATGPTTCSGWAELMTSPKMTPSAPMATTALTPTTADNNLTRFC
jgi:hypothetical protein